MNILPEMTASGLWNLMDELRVESWRIARGWREAIDAKVAYPIDPDLCRENAVKWEQFSEIFKEARTKIYDTAPRDFKEESCGA